tara:strand:- start:239 stop:496 length:258 start_codon:yes stop_codon:yes gene_type:complete
MKELVNNLIYELELKKELEKIEKSNYIQFDDYFKNSGKTEKYTKEFAQGIENRKKMMKWVELKKEFAEGIENRKKMMKCLKEKNK